MQPSPRAPFAPVSRISRILLPMVAALMLGAATPPAPPAADLVPFAPWINGSDEDEPETQVQAIDADTYVIRQSVRTDFEAPFLYLIFGSERALLIDSGAGGLKIRPTVERLIGRWRAAHDNKAIHLVVAHSHSHGDHHQGDSEFTDRRTQT